MFSISQGEKGYYFPRSYYQIIISAKGRKGISITINSTPTTLLPDILGYKFPMQIRIHSRSLKLLWLSVINISINPLPVWHLSLSWRQLLWWFWFISCWKCSEDGISEAERICPRSLEIQKTEFARIRWKFQKQIHKRFKTWQGFFQMPQSLDLPVIIIFSLYFLFSIICTKKILPDT